MQKLFGMLLGALMMLGGLPALAAAPVIESLEYEGNGIIEIDFVRDVQYDSPAASLRDPEGATVFATIIDRDDDSLTIRAGNVAPGAAYDITLTGVQDEATGDGGAITGRITIPEANLPAISQVEYDADDRTLDIEFAVPVDFRDATVTVTDASDADYGTKIVETDEDSLEVRVDGLTIGKRYFLRVSGVSLRGGNDFRTVAAEFTATDD